MLKILSILLMCFMVGCSGNPLKVENRLVCTVDKSKAFVLGDTGILNGALVLSDKDAALVCADKTVAASGVK